MPWPAIGSCSQASARYCSRAPTAPATVTAIFNAWRARNIPQLKGFGKDDVPRRFKKIKADPDFADEAKALKEWIRLDQQQSELKSKIKAPDMVLDKLAYNQYAQLGIDDIKSLVVDDKWLPALAAAVQNKLDRVSQTLPTRIRQFAKRYDTPLPQLNASVAELEAKVSQHLERMGFKA